LRSSPRSNRSSSANGSGQLGGPTPFAYPQFALPEAEIDA
jgi:hypothetical protein